MAEIQTISKEVSVTTGAGRPWKAKKTIAHRYILAVMSLFGFFHLTNLRINLSTAIVAMTTNQSSVDADGIATCVSHSDTILHVV